MPLSYNSHVNLPPPYTLTTPLNHNHTTRISHLNLLINLHPPINQICNITCSLSYIPFHSYTKYLQYHYRTIQLSPPTISHIVLLIWTYLITSSSHTITKLTHSQVTHIIHIHHTFLLKPSPSYPSQHTPPSSSHVPKSLTCLIHNLIIVFYITHFITLHMYLLAQNTFFNWLITIFTLYTFRLLAPNKSLITHAPLFGTLDYNPYTQPIFNHNLTTQLNLPHKHRSPTHIHQPSNHTHNKSPKSYMPKHLQYTTRPSHSS